MTKFLLTILAVALAVLCFGVIPGLGVSLACFVTYRILRNKLED